MSCVQLSEGGFQVAYPLGLWSRFSGVFKVLYVNVNVNKLRLRLHLHLHLHTYIHIHTRCVWQSTVILVSAPAGDADHACAAADLTVTPHHTTSLVQFMAGELHY